MAEPGGRRLTVVGVPIDSLGTPGGTELSPAALRRAGVVERLAAEDAGDLDVRIVGAERDPASGIVGYPTVVTTCEGVRDGLVPLLRDGRFPVVLGGCCSLVPGVAAALRADGGGPSGLAYIDGHLDIYDPVTSPTGEAADMPVAVAVGHGDDRLTGLAGPAPMIAPEHVALLAHRDTEEAIGLGSVTPAQLGIGLSRDCNDVRAGGPAVVGADAAQRLAGAAGRFWLSIDVDVLATAAFGATPVQQDGGLSVDELVELAAPLARHPACAGLDLLCYDAAMDDEAGSGAETVVSVLERLLAER